MSIQESNKMIAEFMGLSIKEGVCYYTDEDDMFPMGIEVEEPYIPYDEDWNWLMPVVDKIEDMGCEIVTTNGKCTISGANDYYGESIGKSRRGATYQGVVEFINQYNNNESTD